MSALGQKRTLCRVRCMSALPPIADIKRLGRDVGRTFSSSPQTALLANDLDHSHQCRINQEQRVVYDREPEGSKFRQVCDYHIR